MKTIRENEKILASINKTRGSLELYEALIYRELKGSFAEDERTDEELKEFIHNLAKKWQDDCEIHLLPQEIFNEIF